ncbi:MAG: hypothetical protein J4F29_15910 [Candidatus Latescibacteria bacterium]|nr:hypothetical protein [Candidatus Latescibacterota bacterium]
MRKKIFTLLLSILLTGFVNLPFLYSQTEDIIQEYTDEEIKEPEESDFVDTYEDELDYFNDSELNSGEYEEFIADEEYWDFMDHLRSFLGDSITLSSAYRNPEKNDSVGGARNSIHQYGGASDLVAVGGVHWEDMDVGQVDDLLWAINYISDFSGYNIDVVSYDDHLHIERGGYCDYPS